MARSLVKLGASTEARTLLHSGKQCVGEMPFGYTRDLIGTLETALN
ncbi:MAG: hypothetical protein H7Y38_14485 [Armatimonadetes bacterium]|nr:hypothetical protein [Armatimonadota bacterium]